MDEDFTDEEIAEIVEDVIEEDLRALDPPDAIMRTRYWIVTWPIDLALTTQETGTASRTTWAA